MKLVIGLSGRVAVYKKMGLDFLSFCIIITFTLHRKNHQTKPPHERRMMVDWHWKAAVQMAFSFLPYGHRLNYLAQRYVTRSLPRKEHEIDAVISIANMYIDVISRLVRPPLAEMTFYEFGAGWDLLLPLTMYALGVRKQILVDIRRLISPHLVNLCISELRHRFPTIEFRSVATGRHFGQALLDNYGIRYIAPLDARRTNLSAGCIDCITSTNTLEHIPPEDIWLILQESLRILKPDGVMVFRIDYQDHYSYADKSISPYNFLRYSERQWRLVNPPLHFQNRLRHRDYLRLFSEAGLSVVEEIRGDGTEDDIRSITSMAIAAEFSDYSPEELAVRWSIVALQKVTR